MTNNLKISLSSCEDYILYYDDNMPIGFEAQFDNGKFNGKISVCENIGSDEEEWNNLENEYLYQIIKEKAIQDFIHIKGEC